MTVREIDLTDRTIARARSATKRYPATFLACRDVGHNWTMEEDFHRARNGMIARVLACSTCTTTRSDLWYANGVRFRNTYGYPEGYLVPAGQLSPLDVRREVLRRSHLGVGRGRARAGARR